MTGHHPLCPMGQDLAHRPRLDLDEMQPCQCPIIAAVEALVREQVATAIEALPTPSRSLEGVGRMADWAHRFTFTEDRHTGEVRTLSVDGVRWLSPRDAALQAQTTADRSRERIEAALSSASADRIRDADGTEFIALSDAQRIARGGGSDG